MPDYHSSHVQDVYDACMLALRGTVLLRISSRSASRVTESRVECGTVRARERALYPRFCSLFADEYCSQRVSLRNAPRHVCKFLTVHFVRLVPTSIAKVCTYFPDLCGIYEPLPLL